MNHVSKNRWNWRGWPALLLAGLMLGSFGGDGVSAESAPGPIPIQLDGRVFQLSPGLSRETVKQEIAAVRPDAPSVDIPDYLQYDLILVSDQAPVTLGFEFNGADRLIGLKLDAFLEEQNPPVQQLVAWLKAHAGPPERLGEGQLGWHYQGWVIEHRFGGDGEDSVYAIEFSRSEGQAQPK